MALGAPGVDCLPGVLLCAVLAVVLVCSCGRARRTVLFSLVFLSGLCFSRVCGVTLLITRRRRVCVLFMLVSVTLFHVVVFCGTVNVE